MKQFKFRFFNFNLFVISIFIVISWWGLGGMFHTGFFTSHDGWHQMMRQYHFDQAISEGQLFPRWASQALNGYGYPLFYFTYQLPFFLGKFWESFGMDVFTSLKLSFFLAYFLSGITMYFFTKDIWGKWGAILSSSLYLLAPYRFEDVYVRGSLGEHFVFIFLPILFWGIWKIFAYKKKAGIQLIAIGFAGIALSHALILQFILLPLCLFGVIIWIFDKRKMMALHQYITGGLLGIGLSAYYLLTAIFLKSSIRQLNPDFWKNHVVYLKQLFYSPWGFGGSNPGIGADHMSFQIGIPQWLVILNVLIVLFLGIQILSIQKYKKNNFLKEFLKFDSKVIVFTWAGLAAFILSIYLMLPQSATFWNYIDKYITIDYPFRFILITVFFAALLAPFPVYVLNHLDNKFLQKYFSSFISLKNKMIYIYFIVLISLAFYANRNHIHANLFIKTPYQFLVPSDTSNMDDEYLPKWGNHELGKMGLDKALSKVEIVSGIAKIQFKHKSSGLDFTTQSTTSAQIMINQYYFPTWKLLIDDQNKVEYNDDGLWQFSLNPGTHHVKLFLFKPWWEKLFYAISLISLLSLIYIYVKRKK